MDTCIDMCMDMCRGTGMDMCRDMCRGTCMGVCRDVCRDVRAMGYRQWYRLRCCLRLAPVLLFFLSIDQVRCGQLCSGIEAPGLVAWRLPGDGYSVALGGHVYCLSGL